MIEPETLIAALRNLLLLVPAELYWGLAALLLLSGLWARLSHGIGEASGGRRRFAALLRSRGYDVTQHLVIPDGPHQKIEIDQVVRLPDCLVLVDHHRLHGRLRQDPDGDAWTLRRLGRRRRFLNPLHRNAQRARALGELLPDVPLHTLVVVGGRHRFTDGRPQGAATFAEAAAALGDGPGYGPEDPTAAPWERLQALARSDTATHRRQLRRRDRRYGRLRPGGVMRLVAGSLLLVALLAGRL